MFAVRDKAEESVAYTKFAIVVQSPFEDGVNLRSSFEARSKFNCCRFESADHSRSRNVRFFVETRARELPDRICNNGNPDPTLSQRWVVPPVMSQV